MAAQQKAILFADFKGFSKLQASEAEAFFLDIMPKVEKTVMSVVKPAISNTWGDGLFLIFDMPQDAAICALKIRRMIRDHKDYSENRVYSELGVRIALHNAPVVIAEDPFTKRLNAFGFEINHTARIEPVVPTNEIWTTFEFKAAVEKKLKSGKFQSVGVHSLAKDWGKAEMFRLFDANEKPLPKAKSISASNSKPDVSIAGILARSNRLLEADGRYVQELIDFLSHVDERLLSDSIFRKTWDITVQYDTTGLMQRGVVDEIIEWTYELINLSGHAVSFHHELAGSEEGVNAGIISFNKFSGSDVVHLFEREGERDVVGGVQRHREKDLLDPYSACTLKLVYRQSWPVNKKRPVIHNNFMTRHVALKSSIKFRGPLRQVTVFNKDGGGVRTDIPQTGSTSYEIQEILVPGSSIEYEVELDLNRNPRKRSSSKRS